MSGILNVGSFVTTEDSFSLNQLQDVVISSEVHQNVLTFNDAITDPSFSDGFVGKPPVGIESVDDVNVLATSDHNSVFTFNDNSIETSIVDGWSDKKVNDLLTGLQVTVEGLINVDLSKRRGVSGNPALSDIVAFTDVIENGFTMGISSCGDNNIVFKRELTDVDFVYETVLSKGEILNLSYPKGTIFRSSKGLVGFSSIFPTPMGISSISSNIFRFFAFRNNGFVSVASAGLEAVVTLFASNGLTIIDGPITIPPYGSTTLTCNANNEFLVSSTSNVYCATYAENTSNGLTIDQRLVPPSVNEIIVWNRNARISAQEIGTTVRWYRQNGETGVFSIDVGTPVAIYTGNINNEAGPTNTGNSTDYNVDGALILRSDKPISGFSGADSQGWEATPAWPLNQMAQLFANPATINVNADAGRSSVTIGSQFEGTGSVYESDGTLISTFPIERSVTPATTTDEQLYPAAGQWVPTSDWTGGYVEINVPGVCIMNFNGSTVWTSDAGDEFLVPGVTPTEIKAEIVKDSLGLFRRRDIDASGIETWNIC